MEELLELRHHIEQGRTSEALFLVDELTEMAKEDKINKIESFMVILLMHLIKSHAEKKMMASWQRSMRFAVNEIQKSNKRRESGGHYLSPTELTEHLTEQMPFALREAAAEAFGGAYSHKHIATMIDAEAVKQEALNYILHGIPDDDE
jgi:hypothetical protein